MAELHLLLPPVTVSQSWEPSECANRTPLTPSLRKRQRKQQDSAKEAALHNNQAGAVICRQATTANGRDT
jgi:hypothetical protein